MKLPVLRTRDGWRSRAPGPRSLASGPWGLDFISLLYLSISISCCILYKHKYHNDNDHDNDNDNDNNDNNDDDDDDNDIIPVDPLSIDPCYIIL